MITVDGRTDVEKLAELLNVGTEINELDFKQTLNLRDKREMTTARHQGWLQVQTGRNLMDPTLLTRLESTLMHR